MKRHVFYLLIVLTLGLISDFSLLADSSKYLNSGVLVPIYLSYDTSKEKEGIEIPVIDSGHITEYSCYQNIYEPEKIDLNFDE